MVKQGDKSFTYGTENHGNELGFLSYDWSKVVCTFKESRAKLSLL